MSTAMTESTKHGAQRLAVRRLADVARKPVNWLWPGRIPVGKFSMLCGDPGLGKSLVALDIAARVSCGGLWPDTGTRVAPGSVLLFAGEDDAADTVAPRLATVGADLERVQIVDGLSVEGSRRQEAFSLGEHLDELEVALEQLPDARLVVFDPITAFLQGVHECRGGVVRRMLAGVTEIARRRGVAVVAVTHLSKRGSGPATLRALDSLAFAAAARSVWLIASDPTDPTRRLMTSAKTNLAAGIGGLAYSIETADDQPRLKWHDGRIEICADDLVRLSRASLIEMTQHIEWTPRHEVVAWLREQLIDGPLLRKELWREVRGLGFARRTVYRALHEIGALVADDGYGEKYVILSEQATDLPRDSFDLKIRLESLAAERVVKAAKRRSEGGAET